MSRPRSTNKIILFFVASAAALLAVWLFWSFEADVRALLGRRMGTSPSPSVDTIVGALNFLFFGLAFRLKRIDAPTLIRNIFTIVAFSIFFLVAFTFLFPDVN